MTNGPTTSKPFRLGDYPNSSAEYEKEVVERQQAVVIEVSGFLLQRMAQYPFWVARTKDGKPLPRSLEGQWLSPETFRIAAEKYRAIHPVVGRGKNAV